MSGLVVFSQLDGNVVAINPAQVASVVWVDRDMSGTKAQPRVRVIMAGDETGDTWDIAGPFESAVDALRRGDHLARIAATIDRIVTVDENILDESYGLKDIVDVLRVIAGARA